MAKTKKLPPYMQLEADWARANDLFPANMVACSSGTAALHLAFEAMKFPAGAGVVVPDYSMVACARAVVLAGLSPVLADVMPNWLTLDPDALQDLILRDTDNLVAVLAVHTYGRQCHMDDLVSLCERDGLFLVEDLAEAHGVKPHPYSAAACWSFYKNKIVAGEEGGAVYFKDAAVARYARSLRCLGFTEAHDYTHVPRGHNYRLADLLAKPILKSISTMPAAVRARRLAAERYDEVIPAEWRGPARAAVWQYDVRVPGLGRKRMGEVVRGLQAEGIAARFGFLPLSLQDEFADARAGLLLNSLHAADEVFSLPVTRVDPVQVAARVATLVRG